MEKKTTSLSKYLTKKSKYVNDAREWEKKQVAAVEWTDKPICKTIAIWFVSPAGLIPFLTFLPFRYIYIVHIVWFIELIRDQCIELHSVRTV